MPHGQNVGYIRVSTEEQNTDRQLVGVELDKVFEEKLSAKDTDRPEFQNCMAYLREGDTLYVHSLDRLARSLVDLERTVLDLNTRGITVVFYTDHLVFPAGQEADPTRVLLRQVLGAVAQFERSILKKRQREGISAARRKGKHLGRPAKLTPAQRTDIARRLELGAVAQHLAYEFKVSPRTILRCRSSIS